MPKYIDADKLVDDLRKYHRSRKNYGKSYETISREIYSIINKQSYADVEPKRKSGRWIIAGAFDDFYQCPECGEMWPIFSTIEWKCCPICECKIITNRPKGEDDA